MTAKIKYILLLALFLGALLITGCQTIEGAWRGATEGAKEDWEQAKEVDKWMRENLW